MESSVKTLDVIILSAYGKGVWLANELARLKKKVAFIDLSHSFPYSDEEDLEGPYGFFLSSKIDDFQQQWWKRRWVCSPSGFSILTDKIPIHFKEIFLSSVYKQYPEYQALKEYCEDGKYTDQGSFEKNWLIHLCHQLMSGVDFEFQRNRIGQMPYVFDDFGILSFQKEIRSFLNKDVLFQDQKDHNILIPTQERNFVLSSRQGKNIKAPYFVFMLNPLETNQLHLPLFRLLFSKRKITPSWSWCRFSFQCDDQGYPLPLYLVLASPRSIPWTHERLICLKKSLVYKDRVNAWVRLPFSGLNRSSDMTSFVQKLILELNSYLPQFKWKYLNNSITNNFLFPVYSFHDFQKIRLISHPRFFYSFSPFDLSWTELALKEVEIFKKIQAMG